MPQYSYNIISIATNVIMLEFLSAQCIHPGALLPFYLFVDMSWNIKIKKASKLYTFLFDYNDVRAFEVFKLTAGCIFKCKTTKTKLTKT